MENFIVTTVRKPDSSIEQLAAEVSAKLGGRFVARESFSFDALKQIHGVENILLVRRGSSIFFATEALTWKILS